uniref:Uncharacterized protein n=1 Tax=Arundo donax TaxID=35708 RepID=A0A0A9CBD5_ARUDO
MLVYLSIVRLL